MIHLQLWIVRGYQMQVYYVCMRDLTQCRHLCNNNLFNLPLRVYFKLVDGRLGSKHVASCFIDRLPCLLYTPYFPPPPVMGIPLQPLRNFHSFICNPISIVIVVIGLSCHLSFLFGSWALRSLVAEVPDLISGVTFVSVWTLTITGINFSQPPFRFHAFRRNVCTRRREGSSSHRA
jgi:hypothetical protein